MTVMAKVMQMNGKMALGTLAGVIVFSASLTVFMVGPGLEVARANQSLQMGDLVKAQSIYARLAAGRPNVPQLYYNMGLCHYHRGEYEEAQSQFKLALEGGKSLTGFSKLWREQFLAQVNYQLGNVAVKLASGKPEEEADKSYQEALDYYKQALRMTSRDMEAKYNYELVLQRLSPGQSGSGQHSNPDPPQTPSQTEDYLPEAASEETLPVGNDW